VHRVFSAKAACLIRVRPASLAFIRMEQIDGTAASLAPTRIGCCSHSGNCASGHLRETSTAAAIVLRTGGTGTQRVIHERERTVMIA
jgi:hypothetical protein